MFKEMAPSMLAVCTVFEGKGFWASAARSIMAGITIMIRGFRVKVAGDPAEAVPWVHNQLASAGVASFTEEEVSRHARRHGAADRRVRAAKHRRLRTPVFAWWPG